MRHVTGVTRHRLLVLYLIFFLLLGLLPFGLNAETVRKGAKIQWIELEDDSLSNLKKIMHNEIVRTEAITKEEADSIVWEIRQEKRSLDMNYKKKIKALMVQLRTAKRQRNKAVVSLNKISNEIDETTKRIKNVKVSKNILLNKMARAQEEKKNQHKLLKDWLKTEKHLALLTGTIIKEGKGDVLQDLLQEADKEWEFDLIEKIGTEINSDTKVINNILEYDIITAETKGTFKKHGTTIDPILIESDVKGNYFLLLKAFELYPWQDERESFRHGTPVFSSRFKKGIIAKQEDVDGLIGGDYLNRKEIRDIVINKLEEIEIDNQDINNELRNITEEHRDNIEREMVIIQDSTAELAKEKEKLTLLEVSLTRMEREKRKLAKKRKLLIKEVGFLMTKMEKEKSTAEIIEIKTAPITKEMNESAENAILGHFISRLGQIRESAATRHTKLRITVRDAAIADEEVIRSKSEAKITAVKLLAFSNIVVENRPAINVSFAFRVETRLKGTGEIDAGQGSGKKVKKDDEKVAKVEAASLAPFYIDRYEVSIRDFRECVALGKCNYEDEEEDYYNNLIDPAKQSMPMVYVTMEEARQYCKCMNGDLPTAEQWRAAASSKKSGRYPWGDRFPDCGLANYNNSGEYCYDAGPLPVEKTLFVDENGIAHIAGNVAEWTRSRGVGGAIVKGGGYSGTARELQIKYNKVYSVNARRPSIGFRCVYDSIQSQNY